MGWSPREVPWGGYAIRQCSGEGMQWLGIPGKSRGEGMPSGSAVGRVGLCQQAAS